MYRLDEMLAAGAGKHPSRMFLIGSSAQTYAEAEQHVEERVAQFRSNSFGPVAALAGESDAEWILSLLALIRAGVTAVLIPREMQSAEAEHLMHVSGSSAEIAGSTWRKVPVLAPPTWARGDIAVGFATSGSTGDPRIVLRSHDSLASEAERYKAVLRARADDIFFSLCPLSHAFAFGAALATSLASGSALMCAPFRSPRTASKHVQESRATILIVVPAIARAMASVDNGRAAESSLRVCLAGAGPVPQALSRAFAARWGVGVSRNYGSSETGALLMCLDPVDHETTGAPMPGVEYELVQSSGAGSELWVRQDHPPLGYIGSAGLVEARVAPGGWWPTGDLFERQSGGDFLLTGRIGSVIRRGGHSIYPGEIEAALLQIPEVSDTSVRRAHSDDGEDSIEAHVALVAPGSLSAEELSARLRTKLAPHKIPTRWYLYQDLPRTWSRKIDVRRLAGTADHNTRKAFFDGLRGYRLAHAMFAAEEAGVFVALDGGEKTAASIAAESGCDQNALGLLLDYLEASGVVRKAGSRYSLPTRFSGEGSAICRFERLLDSEWLSASHIASVLRSGIQARRFEREESIDCFAAAYTRSFSGSWQRAVALLLSRCMRRRARAFIIGRAVSRIALELQSLGWTTTYSAVGPHAAAVAGASVPLVEAKYDESSLNHASYDLILVANAIHWFSPDAAALLFQSARAAIGTAGLVAIADIFIDSSNGAYHFIPDWLTHGGLEWLSADRLRKLLEGCGFCKVQSHSVAGSEIQLITCTASQSEQETRTTNVPH